MTYVGVAKIPPEYTDVLNTHESPILVISCAGFYLFNESYEMVNTTGINVYDTLTVPGSSGAIHYEEWRNTLMNQIETLSDLHKTIAVYIIDHQDCGVYKELYGSDRGTESFAHHSTNMVALRSMILAKYPSLKVLMYLASHDGVIYQLNL